MLRIRALLRSYKTGIVGSIGSILWEAFWLVGPPVGIDSTNRRSYLFWGFIALVVAGAQAFTVLISENSSFRRSLEPKFDIVFRPDEDASPDSRPYVQVLEFPVQHGPGIPRTIGRDRRYRVGIVNSSSVVVPAVRVILARCKPNANFIHLGHQLLAMDSKPPAGERDLAPSPTSEPTLYFDVVSEYGDEAGVPQYFTFCYANPDLCGPVVYSPHQAGDYSYEIGLRAEGAGYSCERAFRVSKGWDEQHGRKRLVMESL